MRQEAEVGELDRPVVGLVELVVAGSRAVHGGDPCLDLVRPGLPVGVGAREVVGPVVVAADVLVKPAVRGAVATSLFVSNIYFFTTTDYFGPAAEYQPFLHTWSLGVEEQFYVVYPLLMLLLKRVSAARFRAVLWTIVLVSFVGAWRCWQGSSAGVFYLLPARAWELALGGLVALGGFPPVRRKVLSHALSAIGLLAIAAALVVIDQGMSFPSPWALLPAGGTALLIAYGPSTAVAAR